MDNYKSDLESFINQHLPAAQLLQFAVEEASSQRVILSAPLSVNINDKLTAFGGSQQMLALTCAWSLVYVNMIHAELKEQQFVVAKVNTAYKKPVRTDRFYAVSQVDAEAFTDFSTQAKQGGSARLQCTAGVYETIESARESNLARLEIEAATYLEAKFATTKSN